jgi:DNA-binding transcriptional MocR family regulator
MARHTAAVPELLLDYNAATPLHRQIYEGLRGAILSGRLSAGTRLPATRILSHELHVSRNTVLNAFEQLLAEGYVEGQTGSGTYVSHVLPDDLLRVQAQPAALTPAAANRRLSRRGSLLANTPVTIARDQGLPRAFRPGLPTFDTFPFDVWTRLVARHWKRPPPELLSYGEPAGYRPLREAIAAYLRAARGVQCTAEQVIVVAGSQQGSTWPRACCSTLATRSGSKIPATSARAARSQARGQDSCRCRWTARVCGSWSASIDVLTRAWPMSRHHTSTRWG